MIDEIQISPKRGMNATCRGCGKKIRHLTIRGCQKNFSYNDYFCGKCTGEQLVGAHKKIEEIKKDLEKFRGMDTEKREDYLRRLQILKKL